MGMKLIARMLYLLLALLAFLSPTGAWSDEKAAQVSPESGVTDDWTRVIRETPYWQSQGVYHNLRVIRSWVLLGNSYCANPDRQILFDRRGRFLGYLDNQSSTEATEKALNQLRHRLANDNKVKSWIPGSLTRVGYPFALACDQPDVDIDAAVDRMTGSDKSDLLWGSWDGLTVGKPDDQVPLFQVIRQVYLYRDKNRAYSFPDSVLHDLLGQIMIESGARKRAFSAANAKGLMQLRPEVLRDCQIPHAFRLHRMAQIDCALKLVDQNHRNLAPVFGKRFGNLPKVKREELYNLLLVMTYNVGVGRMEELLEDPELSKPAQYFAAHPEHFTANDIALGMLYHNLGRKDIGFSALFYMIDVRIAAHELCKQLTTAGAPWCPENPQGKSAITHSP